MIENAEPGARLNLAFLGGEPLVNRDVLRAATRRALELARARGATINFSITTNGTLLTEDDAASSKTMALPSPSASMGRGRCMTRCGRSRMARGSYDRVMQRVAPLLKLQRRMQVSARVTVTPRNLALRETLDSLIAAGFHSVGFSPMLERAQRQRRNAGATISN